MTSCRLLAGTPLRKKRRPAGAVNPATVNPPRYAGGSSQFREVRGRLRLLTEGAARKARES
jgi:hypothetical protein